MLMVDTYENQMKNVDEFKGIGENYMWMNKLVTLSRPKEAEYALHICKDRTYYEKQVNFSTEL